MKSLDEAIKFFQSLFLQSVYCISVKFGCNWALQFQYYLIQLILRMWTLLERTLALWMLSSGKLLVLFNDDSVIYGQNPFYIVLLCVSVAVFSLFFSLFLPWDSDRMRKKDRLLETNWLWERYSKRERLIKWGRERLRNSGSVYEIERL